jgi:hypothetical protein
MKKLSFYIVAIALLAIAGCKSEMDVEPAKESTFLRYFGSENNHIAKSALEADNGFSLLSTVEIPTDALGNFIYKIRFIHTDLFGNTEWQREYPSFEEQHNASGSFRGFKASSFVVLKDGAQDQEKGYLIIGDRIKNDGSSNLFLLEIDLQGEIMDSLSISVAEGSLQGCAVTVADGGNYIVLGKVNNDPPKDMYVSKVKLNTAPGLDSIKWWHRYGNGASNTPTNKIFRIANNQLSWGASVVISDQMDSRIIRVEEDREGTLDGDQFGDPTFNESPADVAKTANGFAVIGTKRNKTGGDEDIFINRLSDKGELLESAIQLDFYKLNDSGSTTHLNDQGNAISQTAEGGFILLGTVESGSFGNGRKDYWLIKTNALGGVEWHENYGGPDDEEGASVIQTTDGSYLVYGTTNFGNLKKLMLMKVSSKGKL